MPRLSTTGAAILAVAGAAGAATAFLVALVGGYGDHHGLVASGRALAVLIPIAVGLHQWRRGDTRRYPALLVLLGFVMVLVGLAEAWSSLAYSTGRVAGWAVEVLLIVLFLVYPSGRFLCRRDRWIGAAAGLLLVLVYFPSALITVDFPAPSAVSTCVSACPPNAFSVVAPEPAMVRGLLVPVRETATVLLMLLVAATVGARLLAATPLARRTLEPVLAVAVGHAVTLAALFTMRAADVAPGPTGAVGWLVFLCIPCLALAVEWAEVRRRQYVATALERLAVGLPTHTSASALQRGMARSLEDPGLWIAFRRDHGDAGWIDERGRPVELPDDDTRAVTEIRSEQGLVAAIVHDPWLAEAPALLAAASSYSLVVLENERLVTDLRTSLGELADSRARVVAVADDERRRIERDLHDGAQQRLVGLRIQLELAAERIRRPLPRESEALIELGGAVDATIDEVRTLARGVFPAVLADQGLEEALRSAARRAPIATALSGETVRRFGPEIESTVYFACVEALQNAVKHGAGATRISISLAELDGRLRFEVSDDGGGFERNGGSANGGAGLVNMHDRVAAVGGELAVVSSPGAGTRVIGSVPTA